MPASPPAGRSPAAPRQKTVRLRPHHLLCILTYVGKGYGEPFTANLTAIAQRIGAGEAVMVVAGPDDVCAPLRHEGNPHCLRSGAAQRDQAAARQVGLLLGRPVAAGVRIVLGADAVRRLRAAFAAGDIRDACRGCEWSALCASVAADRYRGAVLRPPPS